MNREVELCEQGRWCCVNREVVLGCRSWMVCLAGHLFSVVSVDTVIVTVLPTTFATSCGVHELLSTYEFPHRLTIYCCGGGR